MSRSGVEFHVKDGNLVRRAVLVILGSAISSVFNKMYGFLRITYNNQASSSGMTTSHLLVAVAFYWKAVVEEGSRSYGVMGILSLVGLVSFVVFFSLGIGAIPWVIMSEILPINIKGLAGSIATPPTAQILVDNYDIKLASTPSREVNTLEQELLLCKEESGKLKEKLKKKVNTLEQELLLCKEENEKFKEELKKKDQQEGDKEEVQPQTEKAVHHHVPNEDAEMVPNECAEMVPNESPDFRGPSISIDIPQSPIPKEKEKEQRNDGEKEAEKEIKMTFIIRKVKNNRDRKTMHPNFTKEGKTKPLKKVMNLDTGKEILDKGKQVRDIDSGPLLDPKTSPYYHGL
ncbi:hypothetical protein IFM89_026452 [Coptis chinensis]|uniref:Uncharacterized protein n=1 Tax=Coptis chinensis TaxID=261450 RepID=A0A835IDV6_9MAGN|nr:hypothetical protein IFM89_026452 [Coptis chinensis]